MCIVYNGIAWAKYKFTLQFTYIVETIYLFGINGEVRTISQSNLRLPGSGPAMPGHGLYMFPCTIYPR